MSTRIKWTDEMLFEAAVGFNTRWEFQKGNNKAYQAAIYRGLLDRVCNHMKVCLTNWTDEMLFEAAANFETRDAFAIGNTNAYDAALRRGALDRICQHMILQYKVWTDEMLFEAACEFNTRSAFASGNMNAYYMALRRGLLGQVCAHMKRGVNGFNPEEPGAVYIVALDNPVQSYIGFGISNDVEYRLGQHHKNSNREGFSLTVLRVINFDNGKDAYNLELKLKRNLPIVNAGIDGFRTEAILASDYAKLEELIYAH